ncbi:S66 peptidase family protein [Adhaeribacter rhizoryzae]|uniref:LD-carboxypeptidase n=1 Tax=Adhaeribacter rhizoryzae TaxID=2607907 RepID=A0A5M6DMQ7_9BACT|nr:LD-carboxypeptidase [Adhaeribacter rhizoryzae]KAA5547552.1 LD-carboxypeptidase [Adhaeribacter rhizoryzae]
MINSLQAGDKVAIVALARKVDFADLEPGINILESWGLQVVLGKTLYESFHQFAGPDEIRLADFQTMLDDPEIKAIFSARGGYGTTRLLDQINFTNFRQQPKWLIGFSDITALHSHIHNFGIESIHGTMPALFAKTGAEEAVESLRKILFGENITYQSPAHDLNILGQAEGPLGGGNLSLLVTCIGTTSDIDTSGKILFLEDLDEYLYHIDRMMVQLDRAGKLKNLAGLIVGSMSDMKDNAVPFGKNAYEIISEHAGKYGYPVCFDFPTGHEPKNLALVCGRKSILKVTDAGTSLEYFQTSL